jgi:outer membrane protein assembly factor BamD (BamD/ComL family)
MKKSFLLFVCLLSLSLHALEEEELVWDSSGSSAAEFHSLLQDALTDKDWWRVVDYADILSYNFPSTPFAQESAYFMGYAYFQLGQYEMANKTLTAYLNQPTSHPHFEKALGLKFEIAEAFQQGTCKPLFGSPKLPKWVSAKEDAVQIYDEIIAALPQSEIATRSLLGKSALQLEFGDYKPAVETLQTVIRRFPKQEGAAEAFLAIHQVYLAQCKNTSLDLDLLDLAEMNLRKFRLAFPREPRLEAAEKVVGEMQELFAQNLLETGRFFEKTKKIPSSLIYYNKVMAKYPHTQAALVAEQKVSELNNASK